MNYQLIIDYSIGRWGYSKQYVRSVLAAYKGKHVDVKISSPGGELDHGLDIRQQFLDHGDVTVHISGFTASAATVIAMGAKKVCMSRYAMFLVHKCSNFVDVWGNLNADEMQKLIDDLTENKRENDKIDVVLANMYAARCGKKVSEILDILKAGRWLSAQEALELGFIDEIEEEPGAKAPVLDEDLKRKLNAFGLGFHGIPEPQSSLWDRVKASIFGQKTNESATAPGDSEEKDTQNTQSTPTQMKTLTLAAAMAAVLGAESVEVADSGTVNVTEAQFSKISAKLDSLASDVAAKEAAIKDLEEKVAALEKLPAATTDEAKEDDADSKVSAKDMYDAVKNLY